MDINGASPRKAATGEARRVHRIRISSLGCPTERKGILLWHEWKKALRVFAWKACKISQSSQARMHGSV